MGVLPITTSIPPQHDYADYAMPSDDAVTVAPVPLDVSRKYNADSCSPSAARSVAKLLGGGEPKAPPPAPPSIPLNDVSIVVPSSTVVRSPPPSTAPPPSAA